MSGTSVVSSFTDIWPAQKFNILLTFLAIYAQLLYCYSQGDNLPDGLSTPEECARECRDGGQPRTCYYKFVIEYYTTVGAACVVREGAGLNRSIVSLRGDDCIILDGVEKSVFSINRMIPGPSIQVCKHDRLIIDVHNAAEGLGVTIHWHGIFQNGYQYYDGVPFVTQCPITSENTFRYQFAVDNSGTHFYHSHISTQMIDGLYGSLIVRTSPSENPHFGLYDEDRLDHLVFLSDMLHELSLERFPGRYDTNRGQTAENILINGKGNWKDPNTGKSTNAPLQIYTVNPGKKYRFRMINSFSTVCLAEMTIEGHSMTIISQDGADVQPVKVDNIITATGERVDFIINADQIKRSYWIQVRGLGECSEKSVQQLGILRYQGAPETPPTPAPTYSNQKSGLVYNPLDATECNGKPSADKICVNQMKSMKPVDKSLLQIPADMRIVLSFDFFDFNSTFSTLFGSQNGDTYRQFFVANDKSHLTSLVRNIHFANPPGPPISQKAGYSKVCTRKTISTCTEPCTCSQMYEIPKGYVIEIVTYDRVPMVDLAHPFHLHGYEFYVFAMGQFNRTITKEDISQVITDHTNRLGLKGYDPYVPGKDTVVVPQGGYVIVRFKADNPGYWLYHCHFSWHTVTGMNVVFHIGSERDLPPVPSGFPECYDFTPPPVFWDKI